MSDDLEPGWDGLGFFLIPVAVWLKVKSWLKTVTKLPKGRSWH